jgi:hypothetical protein
MIEFGGFGGFGQRGGMSWQQQAITKGWGYGSINPGSIQPDNNQLRSGIIGLTNKGEPRKPDQWGALRAWGWGISRLIDFFEANPDAGVDPKKVGIKGVSRYGKAALVTAAFDERIAVAFVASSGEGGAKLHRHVFGEAVENLTGRGGYHWMAGNFLKYGASDPCMTAADLPVDSHKLIALCAPVHASSVTGFSRATLRGWTPTAVLWPVYWRDPCIGSWARRISAHRAIT